MIDDSRREYWDVNHSTVQQGDSLAFPVCGYEKFFKNKIILEIGPGEGRQYDYIYKYIKIRAVADISKKVLSRPKYRRIKKFWIKTYDDDFNIKFDVIHFWYVLHHVKSDELEQFFDFTRRHLLDDGIMFFNTPVLEHPDSDYGDDGILTTRHSIEDVGEALNKHYFWQADKSRYGNSNGYTVAAEPK